MDTNKLKEQFKRLKPADSKRKAQKTYTPPGTSARKAGVFAFWFLFIMMATSFLLNLLFTEDDTMAIAEPPEDNLAASAAGIEFAKRFAADFFTWEATAEGFKEREATLAPYLANGLDASAGLETSGQRWNASAGKVEVLHVEPIDDQRAIVTVKVKQSLERTNEDDDEKKDKESVTHTFSIPVAHADGFGVYELPSFAAAPTDHNVEQYHAEGESPAREDVVKIEGFLNTFFQSYVSDPPDKLAYFMTAATVKGLEEAKELETVEVLDVRTDGSGWTVLASTKLIEPKTESVFYSNYRLTVIEENGRFLVESINKGAN